MALFSKSETPSDIEELAKIKIRYNDFCVVGVRGDDLYFVFDKYTYSAPMLGLVNQAEKHNTEDVAKAEAQTKLLRPFQEKIAELEKEITVLKIGEPI